MPEAALVVAQAYLLTTQPKPGDPREHMHQAAIKSLGLVEDELKQKSSGRESTYHEHIGRRSQKSQSPQTRRTNSPEREDHEARRGGRKEYHHIGQGEQIMLCMGGTKIRG
jgi:hypothetical protein